MELDSSPCLRREGPSRRNDGVRQCGLQEALFSHNLEGRNLNTVGDTLLFIFTYLKNNTYGEIDDRSNSSDPAF